LNCIYKINRGLFLGVCHFSDRSGVLEFFWVGSRSWNFHDCEQKGTLVSKDITVWHNKHNDCLYSANCKINRKVLAKKNIFPPNEKINRKDLAKKNIFPPNENILF